jgi:ATP-binding cassette, subfamily G (WHITE), member 2, SNQ2
LEPREPCKAASAAPTAMDTDTPLNHSTKREETSTRVYESITPTHHEEDAIQNFEKQDKGIEYNPNGYSAIRAGVNVERAEAEFAELSKELSRASQHSHRLSRTQSGQKGNVSEDVEKAPESETSDEELFDLETTLRGNKGLEEEAGIKSKRIGVVWENLTVSGIGGVKNYVKVRRAF